MLWTIFCHLFTAHAPLGRTSTSGFKSDRRFRLNDIDFL